MKSRKPSTNRNRIIKAPNHRRVKKMNVRLSNDLQKRHGCKQLPVRRGDTVRIISGFYSKPEPMERRVNKVNLAKGTLQVDAIKSNKADGTEIWHPIDPSNVIIVTLTRIDNTRKKIIQRRKRIKQEED